MKIRVKGTKAECKVVQEYYKDYVQNNACVKDYRIPGVYVNKGNRNLYRVYIYINYIIFSEPTGGSNGLRIE